MGNVNVLGKGSFNPDSEIPDEKQSMETSRAHMDLGHIGCREGL